jgi:hypothetical protein
MGVGVGWGWGVGGWVYLPCILSTFVNKSARNVDFDPPPPYTHTQTPH